METVETKDFEIHLARNCQAGKVRGYVYCTDNIQMHNLVSEIKDLGNNYFLAWFRDETLSREYMLLFDNKGNIPQSKYKVKINVYQASFKPYDKVIVRDNDEQTWVARLYDYFYESMHYCQDGMEYACCLPYNGNEHLVGTQDKPYAD